MQQQRDKIQSVIAKTLKKVIRLSGYKPEDLAYRVFPYFLLEIIEKYLRVRTEGIGLIPKTGPAIIIANHSGFMGFDAVILAHEIFKQTKRMPRIIAHKLWFFRPEISVHAEKMGMIPASFENGKKILEKGEILLLFPEGEEGNFKPSRYRYKLRRFRRGFVRLALATGAPIIPTSVLGAEETHITLSQIRWFKQVLGIIVPIPLNVIPLPAKWRIKFYAPKKIQKNPELVNDLKYTTKLSRSYRHDLQAKIHTQLNRRKTIYV